MRRRCRGHHGRETGCDAVMIARAAEGNPWIFSQAAAALAGSPEPCALTVEQRIAMARRHARLLAQREGRNIVRMRKHAMWYMTGLPGAAAARGEDQRVRGRRAISTPCSTSCSRLREAMHDPYRALYLHLPFCVKRCSLLRLRHRRRARRKPANRRIRGRSMSADPPQVQRRGARRHLDGVSRRRHPVSRGASPRLSMLLYTLGLSMRLDARCGMHHGGEPRKP